MTVSCMTVQVAVSADTLTETVVEIRE